MAIFHLLENKAAKVILQNTPLSLLLLMLNNEICYPNMAESVRETG